MSRTIRRDERAVEGMPIRLVVAVSVGVAAFGLLIPMLDTVEHSTETEVTVELSPQQLVLDADARETVTIDVVTVDDEPVTDARVLISSRSLPVEGGPRWFETGEDSNSVEVSIGTVSTVDVPVEFRPTQRRGTIAVRVVPPPDGEYSDEMDNPEITIRRS